MHPAHAQDSADCFGEVIHDLSTYVRRLELELYGRAHPQTVSLFGPELRWKPHLPLREPFFRHPDLDFATIHIYKERSIDDPRDTVAPAVAMGKIVRESLGEITDTRPFLDTEHGPIHRFKDRKKTLPEDFDDEYFRHIAWAHLASGGAGGGMRWPNRHPHVLTPGMRRAQKAMADFLPLIDWTTFGRRNLDGEVRAAGHHVFACGSEDQALVWLLRRNAIGPDGRMRQDLPPEPSRLTLPLAAKAARVVEWDTQRGAVVSEQVVTPDEGMLRHETAPFVGDLALAIRAL
jgi:mannan endo-1,4-beta-mannosidase